MSIKNHNKLYEKMWIKVIWIIQYYMSIKNRLRATKTVKAMPKLALGMAMD